jgi:hypothetical protein
MTNMPDKRFDLGVLLVHGIGTQSSGDLLIGWGDEILNGIRLATGDKVRPTVERGSIPADDDARAEMEVRLGDSERWLFAEGWWAQSFRAPTYRELVSWGFRALPWALAIRVAQRHWQAKKQTELEKVLENCRALGVLLIALTLSPIFILVLAFTLLLGLLPIPQLREIILTVQSTLTSTVGDSLAFVESPVRAGLIRTRILEGLAHVTDVCERTIVIAHSQGAAVVLQALGGIEIAKGEAKAPAAMPDTLLTFGAGINQLVSLSVLGRGVKDNPAYRALGALAALAAVVGWTYHAIRIHTVTVLQLIEATALYASGLAMFALLMWMAMRLSKRWPVLDKLTVPLLTIIALGGGYFIHLSSLPVTAMAILGFAALILLAALFGFISDDMRATIGAAVRKPAGLERWVDLYASDDPVPNGPILTDASAADESREIFNRGSMFEDHTCYWKNLDGFVLRVVRECANAAKSPWKDDLPPETDILDQRAEWRVGFLRILRWATGAFWLPILAMLWIRWGEQVWIPDDASRWLPAAAMTWLRLTILALAVAFAARLIGGVLQLPWAWWTRYEQKRFMSGKAVPEPWYPLIGMGMFVWIFFLLVWWAVFPEWDAAKDIEGFLALSFGSSVLSMLLLRLLLRPPAAVQP